MMNKIIAVLVAIIMVALTASTGCIDIELAKKFLIREKPKEIIYVVKEHIVKHTFITVITDPASLRYDASLQVNVPINSTRLDMIIRVKIAEFPEINETIRELIENYTIDRYVKIALYYPNGTLRYNDTINKTTAQPIQAAITPMPVAGNWSLVIEAQGVGIKALNRYDSFEVRVRVKQPIEV